MYLLPIGRVGGVGIALREVGRTQPWTEGEQSVGENAERATRSERSTDGRATFEAMAPDARVAVGARLVDLVVD